MFSTQAGFRLAIATARVRWNEGGGTAVCVVRKMLNVHGEGGMREDSRLHVYIATNWCWLLYIQRVLGYVHIVLVRVQQSVDFAVHTRWPPHHRFYSLLSLWFLLKARSKPSIPEAQTKLPAPSDRAP